MLLRNMSVHRYQTGNDRHAQSSLVLTFTYKLIKKYKIPTVITVYLLYY